jgi:hypothetical protein
MGRTQPSLLRDARRTGWAVWHDPLTRHARLGAMTTHCHDYFAHRQPFLKDGFWQLHCGIPIFLPFSISPFSFSFSFLFFLFFFFFSFLFFFFFFLSFGIVLFFFFLFFLSLSFSFFLCLFLVLLSLKIQDVEQTKPPKFQIEKAIAESKFYQFLDKTWVWQSIQISSPPLPSPAIPPSLLFSLFLSQFVVFVVSVVSVVSVCRVCLSCLSVVSVCRVCLSVCLSVSLVSVN